MTKCGPWRGWPSRWSERVCALDQTLGTRPLPWYGGFAGCFHSNLWSHSSRNECQNCVVVRTQWYEQTTRPCSLVASIRDSSSIGFVSTISASSALDDRDAITFRICARDDWRIAVVSKDIALLCFLTAGCKSSDMVIGNSVETGGHNDVKSFDRLVSVAAKIVAVTHQIISSSMEN